MDLVAAMSEAVEATTATSPLRKEPQKEREELVLRLGFVGGMEVVFTCQPLGIEFENEAPITIATVVKGSQAERLGVQVGWVVKIVNGKDILGEEFEAQFHFLASAARSLPAPKQAAALAGAGANPAVQAQAVPMAGSASAGQQGNLLATPLRLEPGGQVERLAVHGANCVKVGRNGKRYKRTFKITEAFIRTNGRDTRELPLRELTGVFYTNSSEEFNMLKKDRPAPGTCCVLTTRDRSFSLAFDSISVAREFAETAAFFAQRQLQHRTG